MRVVWTGAAVREVWRAYEYIHDFNPYAARRLADALFAAGDRLVDFPHAGRTVAGIGLRELVTVRPYIIRYRVIGDEVIILRVRHAARQPTNP